MTLVRLGNNNKCMILPLKFSVVNPEHIEVVLSLSVALVPCGLTLFPLILFSLFQG